ncbi:metaxin-3 isoform X1 [Corvus hawaiiensis]|uniref:metaxin-3 isoform X1 n=1 Tax=Corvus hawaiiensis TaxID=134902 RepID=UPI0020198F28|nr:metaxin-3 isoform X1 [Corvus hawaiiensis]
MAAPMELSCWGGDWGLPSLHPECLTVMAYAKFSGAPVTVNTVNNSWRAPKEDLPVLVSEDIVISQPAKILNFLRKQKYNADYDLSAKQGADTLAYIALLEEKLLPALLHTFWIEAENYCSVTKPWFASKIAFPLSLYLPGKMSREALNRILLTKGGPPLYSLTEVEAQIYRDAKECLNLLSKRLGTAQFFFGDTPTTLDAFVFGFLAPIYKVCFPRVQLQEHLKQLPNLCRFCDDILTCYFRLTVSGYSPAGQDTADANLQKLTQLVNKESNLIEKVTFTSVSLILLLCCGYLFTDTFAWQLQLYSGLYFNYFFSSELHFVERWEEYYMISKEELMKPCT